MKKVIIKCFCKINFSIFALHFFCKYYLFASYMVVV